jgi:hypothetical protein
MGTRLKLVNRPAVIRSWYARSVACATVRRYYVCPCSKLEVLINTSMLENRRVRESTRYSSDLGQPTVAPRRFFATKEIKTDDIGNKPTASIANANL